MSDIETISASDALLQTGALTDEQARVVAEHQARSGLSFDQSAVSIRRRRVGG